MTKALASAWAKDNIQANAILPGWIDTDLTRTAREQVAGLQRACRRPHARRPLGRAGRFRRHRRVPRQQASDFVTGAAMPVDGGYSAQGLRALRTPSPLREKMEVRLALP